VVRVVCGSREPGAALAAADAVRERIEAPDGIVLGPAPLFRLRGRERAQVVVKAPAQRPVVGAVGLAVAAAAASPAGRRASFSVDVDPQ
jgi:primosomal protein N' (replication factor Y) (superfamily II helicase)